MAKTVLFAGGIEAFTSSATARYTPFATTYTGSDLFSSSSVEIEYQNAGVLSDFSVVVYVNNRSGVASSTCGPYINGSASAVTVTIPIGTTGRFTDTTNTASVAANDDLSLGTHPQNGGGGAVQLGNWLCVFDQTTGSHFRPTCYINGTAVGVGTTYPPIVSGSNTSRFATTESAYTMDGIAGTVSYLAVRSGSNGRNGDVVITFRKNGADGASTVTVPASTTGNFIDTTNSDSIADGDDINYKCVRGGTTGTVTLQSISVNYAGTGDAFMSLACGDAVFAPPSATDYFFHIGGLLENNYTDALTKQLWPLDNFEASRLEVVIPTNDLSLDSTFVLRKNGADSALSITIPNGTTGRFTNTSSTVSLMDGDEINYKLAAGDTGNITVRQTGIKFAPAGGGGPTFLPRLMLLGVG